MRNLSPTIVDKVTIVDKDNMPFKRSWLNLIKCLEKTEAVQIETNSKIEAEKIRCSALGSLRHHRVKGKLEGTIHTSIIEDDGKYLLYIWKEDKGG